MDKNECKKENMMLFFVDNNGVNRCDAYYYCLQDKSIYEEVITSEMEQAELNKVTEFVGIKQWQEVFYRLAEYLYLIERKKELQKKLDDAPEKVNIYFVQGSQIHQYYFSVDELVEQEYFFEEKIVKLCVEKKELEIVLEEGYFHSELYFQLPNLNCEKEIVDIFHLFQKEENSRESYQAYQKEIWGQIEREKKVKEIQDALPFQIRPSWEETDEYKTFIEETKKLIKPWW